MINEADVFNFNQAVGRPLPPSMSHFNKIAPVRGDVAVSLSADGFDIIFADEALETRFVFGPDLPAGGAGRRAGVFQVR